MKNWEYRVISSKQIEGGNWFKGKSREALESYLNELGGQGWEVITVDWNEMDGHASFTGIAKREKISADNR